MENLLDCGINSFISEQSVNLIEAIQFFFNLAEKRQDAVKLVECIKMELNHISNGRIETVETHSNLNIISDCIKFVTENQLNFQTPELKIGLTYEILFFLLLIRLKIIQRNLEIPFTLGIQITNIGCNLVQQCIEFLDYEKANYYFDLTLLFVNHLLENCYSEKKMQYAGQLEHIKISLLTYQVEILAKSNEPSEALDKIDLLKDRLLNSSVHQKYMACLCYNMGLKYKKKSVYEVGLSLLKQAYDMGKESLFSSDMLFSILKLIAEIYLKFKPELHWQKAIIMLELAYSKVSQIDSNYFELKLKAALIGKNENTIEDIIKELLRWKDLSEIVSHNTINLLLHCDSYVVAVNFLRQIRTRFSVEETFNFLASELKIHFKKESVNEAKLVIEYAINVLKIEIICLEKVNLFCRIIISYAISNSSQHDSSQVILWYQYCDQLYEKFRDSQDSLYFLIQKQICLHSIKLNNITVAEKAFSKFEGSQNDDFFNYLELQLAIIGEDNNLTKRGIERLGNKKGILLGCCNTAFAAGKKETLINILETLMSSADMTVSQQIFAITSQCLIRLYIDELSNDNQEKIKICMDRVLEVLQNKQMKEIEVSKLSQWFSRIAWTLGLRENQSIENTFHFILVCCSFLVLCQTAVPRIQNCLLIAAAAGLNAARITHENNKYNILNKVMAVIEQCRCLEMENNVATLRLLYLYELEVKAETSDPTMGETLDEAIHSGCFDIKSLEIVATFTEINSKNYSIAIKVLKAIISYIKKEDQLNYELLSKTYHNLLQALFFLQEHLNPSLEEETFDIVKNLLPLVKDNYPQLEILWLMTKCWNKGVRSVSSGEKALAKEWCSLALALLPRLQSLRTIHEQKMKQYYAIFFKAQEDVAHQIDMV